MKYLKNSLVLVLVAIVVISIGLVSALSKEVTSTVFMQVNNPEPKGSMALAKVLENKGVSLTAINSYQQLSSYLQEGSTKSDLVVVINPNYLSANQIRDLDENAGADILYANFYKMAAGHFPNVQNTVQEDIKASCDLPILKPYYKISYAYSILKPQPESINCFKVDQTQDSGYVFVQTQKENDKTISYLADITIFSNESITEADNAVFAINLFSQYKNIYWYVASGNNVSELTTPSHYYPSWYKYAGIMLLITAITLFISTSRRLGPVVYENLPVTVQMQEIVIAKANLYRKNNLQTHCIKILRTYYLYLIKRSLKIYDNCSKDVLISQISPYTTKTEQQLDHMLFSGEVKSNEDLKILATDLKNLEQEVKDGNQSSQ